MCNCNAVIHMDSKRFLIKLLLSLANQVPCICKVFISVTRYVNLVHLSCICQRFKINFAFSCLDVLMIQLLISVGGITFFYFCFLFFFFWKNNPTQRAQLSKSNNSWVTAVSCHGTNYNTIKLIPKKATQYLIACFCTISAVLMLSRLLHCETTFSIFSQNTWVIVNLFAAEIVTSLTFLRLNAAPV